MKKMQFDADSSKKILWDISTILSHLCFIIFNKAYYDLVNLDLVPLKAFI